MDAEQVLAFRLARSGLAPREAGDLAEAASCPASDFAPGAALLALAARSDGVSREGYREAADAGELVVAHTLRGAIHALAPADLALYGRALISRDDEELGAQIGRQVQRLAAEKCFAPTEALAEVAGATKDALARGRALDKNELHEELRGRVREELMPWCRGCKSHHVAPMLWRYATVQAGARLDSERRYRLAKPGRAPSAREALRRFLSFYGPARRLRGMGRARQGPRPAPLGRSGGRALRGSRRRARRVAPAPGPRRARIACLLPLSRGSWRPAVCGAR
jgi:DNA glycosylase AlkZ-like